MAKQQGAARIAELFTQIDQIYFGPEERALIDEAIGLAQEIGDDWLEYQGRMRLTSSACLTGDTDAMLSSFAWCLAKHDADPHHFPADIQNGGADLYWQYKWMVGAVDASPIFAKTQAEALLDDMERHYRQAGIGLSGVLTARWQHAWKSGDLEAAKELREIMLDTKRDAYSHCDACIRSELAGFALEVGEPEVALELVKEIVEGGYSCGEEPEHALSRTLVAKLRAGKFDDAKFSHVRSYRLARSNPDNIEILADNLAFCAITGNEARGLSLVERHLNWLTHDALNESGRYTLLLAIAQVMEAVDRAGYGEQIVRGANEVVTQLKPDETGDEPFTVTQVAAFAWQTAGQIATAFDERNGNDYYANGIEQAKQLLEEHYDVPLGSDVFLPTPPPVVEPQTPAQWLEHAQNCLVSGMLEAAMEAAERAMADPELTLKALQVQITARLEQEDPTAALQLVEERCQLLEQTGDAERAAYERRLGLSIYGSLTADDLKVLSAVYDELAPAEPSELRSQVQLYLSLALGYTDNHENLHTALSLALEVLQSPEVDADTQLSAVMQAANLTAVMGQLDKSIEFLDEVLAEADLIAGKRAAALRLRARVRGLRQEYLAGAQDADEATRINAELHFTGSTATAASLAGSLYLDANYPETAVQRFRFALREAEQLTANLLGLRFDYGRALLLAGHPNAAIEVFDEVFSAESTADTLPGDRGQTLEWLGRAYEAAGQFGTAVGCWADAANLFEQGELPAQAAHVLARRASLLRAFGEYDDALADLDRAMALAESLPDMNGLLVLVLESRGMSKADNEDSSGIADIDRAIQIAEGDGQEWRAADLIDSKARALSALGRHDESVRQFLTSADAYLAAGDPASSARAESFAAQVLTVQEKLDEAASVFSGALDRVEAITTAQPEVAELRASIALKLGDVLESLGRPTEAAEIRKKAQ
ncbi:MAG: hypothetical protein LBR20_02570 [Propionibacteriaceae bacterium]|jgi:tetratricopeptide (TPR) repeat protein|nr:hypothetical protein [Propionibacteriaceae bacterium]